MFWKRNSKKMEKGKGGASRPPPRFWPAGQSRPSPRTRHAPSRTRVHVWRPTAPCRRGEPVGLCRRVARMRRPGHVLVDHQEHPTAPASPSSSICASPLSLSLLRPRAAATSAARPPLLAELYHSTSAKSPTQSRTWGRHSLPLRLLHLLRTLNRQGKPCSNLARSRGPAVSDLLLSRFLVHCDRLASPHLLRPIAASLLAGIASSAVSVPPLHHAWWAGCCRASEWPFRVPLDAPEGGERVGVVPSPEISLAASSGHRSSFLLCATKSVGSGPTCRS